MPTDFSISVSYITLVGVLAVMPHLISILTNSPWMVAEMWADALGHVQKVLDYVIFTVKSTVDSLQLL